MNVKLEGRIRGFDLQLPHEFHEGLCTGGFHCECSISLTPKDQATLKDIYCERSTSTGPQTIHGSGVGVVIESPDGYSMEHFIKFEFKASNNAAEYEATLTGMDLEKLSK